MTGCIATRLGLQHCHADQALLDGHKFDAEMVRLMGIAFEMALVVLARTDGTISPTRDAVAKRSSSLRKPENASRGVCATRPWRL